MQAHKWRISSFMTPLVHLNLSLHGSFKEAGEPLSEDGKRRKAETMRAFAAMFAPNFELEPFTLHSRATQSGLG